MQTAETTPTLMTGETAACICAAQPLMSVPEVATILNRSTEYLYAGLREGRFPGARFGRAWAIPRKFVRGFVVEVVEIGLSTSFEEYAAQWLARGAA